METEGLLGGMRQRQQHRRGGFAAIRSAEPISHQWMQALGVSLLPLRQLLLVGIQQPPGLLLLVGIQLSPGLLLLVAIQLS
ncbi:MAG: hypothetical protein LC652_09140, partial [Halomonas sp.]|nr:hypothetical protein [Halomonas sp.]